MALAPEWPAIFWVEQKFQVSIWHPHFPTAGRGVQVAA